jgi:hypothetical protein
MSLSNDVDTVAGPNGLDGIVIRCGHAADAGSKAGSTWRIAVSY